MLLCISFVISFKYVTASSGFVNNKDVWYNENDSFPTKSDDYPYSEIDKGKADFQINTVSLDVAYGTSRQIVVFHGEVPTAETMDGEKMVDGFTNKPHSDSVTTIQAPESGNNHTNSYIGFKQGVALNVKDDNYVLAKSYWGFDTASAGITLDDGKIDVDTLQNVNSTDVVSLRLLALTNTFSTSGFSGVGFFFGNLIYAILKGINKIALMLITLLISVKNLNIKSILDVLQLDKLGDMLTKAFISNNGVISPLLVFMIIIFMFTVVAQVINYVKGKTKERAIFTDIIITALLGVICIGACLSGKFWSVGNTLADFTSKIMYTLSDGTTETNQAFKLDIVDKENTNKIIGLQELVRINKAYIDMQICLQFDVDDIEDILESEIVTEAIE